MKISGRTFISERNKPETNNCLSISTGDSRYVNETDFQTFKDLPISNNLNMNNNKIINCNEGTDENDVCIIKNLTVYYKKYEPLNMYNNRITNCSQGVDDDDACTMRNLRNLRISITHHDTDLRMNEHRITNLADGIGLNDAVNIKQLRQYVSDTIDTRRNLFAENFFRKSGILTFNRYGVSVIYKSEIDSVAIGILLVSKGSLYVQEPIVMKDQYTLFIPPDASLYTNKDYYFFYWKCNLVTELNTQGLKVTKEELNHLQQG